MKFLTLPCGAVIKTSSISRLVPMHKEHDDPNRRASKPTVVLHHGPTQIRVTFTTKDKMESWLEDVASQLNNPTKLK